MMIYCIKNFISYKEFPSLRIVGFSQFLTVLLFFICILLAAPVAPVVSSRPRSGFPCTLPPFAKLSLCFPMSDPSFFLFPAQSIFFLFTVLRTHAVFRRRFLLHRHSSSLLPCLPRSSFSVFSIALTTFFFIFDPRSLNNAQINSVPAPLIFRISLDSHSLFIPIFIIRPYI